MSLLADKIKMHLRENLITYIILFLFFLCGVILGGYVTGTYNTQSVGELKDFFEEALNIFRTEKTDYNSIFKNTFTSGIKEIFLIWIMGFTVIGLPLIFFYTVKAGFMLGFVSTFMLSFFRNQGFLLGISLSVVKCVIYIPVMFVISVYGISLSLMLTRMLFGKIRYRINLKYGVLNYILMFILSVPVVILYALAEAYLTANLIVLIA